jgi:hypothetical protein
MKPNDFDNLIRSKFDENDFEYSPGNWDQLVARMDDKPGKRRTFMWVPMAIIASTASIAASLAMIISIPVLMNHSTSTPIASITRHHSDAQEKLNAVAMRETTVPVAAAQSINDINNLAKTIINNTNNRKDNSLSLRATFNASEQAARANNALLAFSSSAAVDGQQVRINESNRYPVYNTFNAAQNSRNTSKSKTTISIAGGLAYGNAMSGYSIGATGKRMLGDHLYIESDLAFVSDNTTEKTEYLVASATDGRAIASRMISSDFSSPSGGSALPSMANPLSGYNTTSGAGSNSQGGIGNSSSSSRFAAARMTMPVTANVPASASATTIITSSASRGFANLATSSGNNIANTSTRRRAGSRMTGSSMGGSTETAAPTPVVSSSAQEREVNYNLYYAQVTPTLGYNIHKKISVGVGADVQRLLLNESSAAGADAGQQASTRELPAFDLGLVGKAECALSNTIKAGVSYRQGMNNVVAPNANYLDRNYVQVQLKFLLLRK